MINLSNEYALRYLREHEKFEEFLNSFDSSKYPGITLEQAYTFISTGVLVEGMNLDSAIVLMRDIKDWASKHSHGGRREKAGRKKSKIDYANITLTADRTHIEKAKRQAKKAGISLQQAFRNWLKELSAEELELRAN